MGFNAYATWQNDLHSDEWYDKNDDEQFARRFSVNQFCTLALYDARKAAYVYLHDSVCLLPDKTDKINQIVTLFKDISENTERIHKLLDSGEYLKGARARQFWTKDLRITQVDLLAQMLEAEREAVVITESFI